MGVVGVVIRLARILATHVAAGGEHVVDLPAALDELGDGAAAEELGVVRVRDDDHRGPGVLQLLVYVSHER